MPKEARPAPSALDAYTSRVRFPLKWGEMDALGHVNNVNVLRFVEEGRIAYFAEIGDTPDLQRKDGFVLASVRCDFLRSVSYPADITVGTSVTRIGTTSLTMATGLFAGADVETPFAVAESICVWVDYTTGTPVALPADMRARIEIVAPP